jgi:hypothetical protein
MDLLGILLATSSFLAPYYWPTFDILWANRPELYNYKA